MGYADGKSSTDACDALIDRQSADGGKTHFTIHASHLASSPMTSGAPSESPAPSAQKARGHYIAPEMPYPRADAPRTPVWKKLWFWLFLVIVLLVSLPALELGWNILRPDTTPPARAKWPEYGYKETVPATSLNVTAGEIGLARVLAKVVATLPAESAGTADIRTGVTYDAVKTPAFLKGIDEATNKIARVDFAKSVTQSSNPPFSLADILSDDGVSRAKAAHLRATHNYDDLTSLHFTRLERVDDLTKIVSSPEGLEEVLRHKRKILEEIRADAPLLAKAEPSDLGTLIRALGVSSQAPAPDYAQAQAQSFDATLDETPDATLRAISDKRTEADTGFIRLALAARKPNEHRRRVSELLRQFGVALAKPTFAEARHAFPTPGETKDIRLSTALLRGEVIRRLGGDYALKYFFSEQPTPAPGLENFSLKFFALSEVKDPYGEALLLHRRASLLALIARRDRTRFEAAATAYALAIEYRRIAKGGVRPKDTDGIFTGFLEQYPLDPFTGDPLLYSRKKANLHSPGADGSDLGGLEEPEFASELTQLWEPTVALDPEAPTNPAAFGLKASDLDKPVIRASDASVPAKQ